VTEPELRRLPKVDKVAAHAALDVARTRLGTEAVMRFARRAVDAARERVKAGAACPELDEVAGEAAAAANAALSARARRVINATGVVLHTNLGRAPLGRAVADAVASSAAGYTSIELELGSGRRGARGAFAEGALAGLCGAEAALVVNNNAAAVLLALSALAFKKKVVVSRGELIEIGGGFRVPDVCARSGAELIEVGTTNKTRLADYARALDEPDVGAILRVHPGNFRQSGFVERPELAQLAKLAHERNVLLIKDLGGGALFDLAPFGLRGEPVAKGAIEAGADVVCFSCDKVLGGPQGGAIVGKRDLVERTRKDPLARALRLGRLPLVALEATLAAYVEGRADDVPVVRMMKEPVERVRARAASWRDALAKNGVEAKVVDVEGAVGGGALAEEPIRSAALAIETNDAEKISARLRTGEPPVVARIHAGTLLLDARTVLEGEGDALVLAIRRAVAPEG
jgi:L-seryl-tRNA(Ser) seleniumtransferase